MFAEVVENVFRLRDMTPVPDDEAVPIEPADAAGVVPPCQFRPKGQFIRGVLIMPKSCQVAEHRAPPSPKLCRPGVGRLGMKIEECMRFIKALQQR